MTTLFAAGIVSPNVGLAFWLIVVFLLVLFVLKRFAWGPITKSLVEREDNIRESLSKAEKALAEAKQLSAANDEARRKALQEANQLVNEAREASERLKSEQIEKTKVEIKRMQEQASADIAREKQVALEALRTEVASLVIQAAEKVVKENLDTPKQRDLVNGFINELSKN